MAAFSCIVVYQIQDKYRIFTLAFVLSLSQSLFVILFLFFEDAQSFRIFPIEMESGMGINPLLLHWAMIIHPPILYIGYVGSIIPFALVLSSLISGKTISRTIESKNNNQMVNLLHKWSLFSWFFLGTGNFIGEQVGL